MSEPDDEICLCSSAELAVSIQIASGDTVEVDSYDSWGVTLGVETAETGIVVLMSRNNAIALRDALSAIIIGLDGGA